MGEKLDVACKRPEPSRYVCRRKKKRTWCKEGVATFQWWPLALFAVNFGCVL